MTKSELKTGYIVTLRDGNEYIVILNSEACRKSKDVSPEQDILLQNATKCWNRLSEYRENLTNIYFSSSDIVKVEKAPNPYSFIDLKHDKNLRKLLWERKGKSEGTVMKYKTKPCEIEAIKWTGENTDEISKFTNGNSLITEEQLYIPTLVGIMNATIGDYIIRGLKGEYYPCKPDVFHKKYELIDE